MRKLLFTLMIAVAALVSLSSCKKDGKADPVVGLWQSDDIEVNATVFGKTYVIKTYSDLYKAIFDIAMPYMSEEEKAEFSKSIEEAENGEESLLDSDEEVMRLELKESGEAAAYYLEEDGNWTSSEGEYFHTDDRLTVYLKEGDGLTELPFKIISLKKKTMVLETDLSELSAKAPSPSMITASMKITFRRIKG